MAVASPVVSDRINPEAVAKVAKLARLSLSDEELQALIDQAVADSGAQAMSDMGKVMGILKPQVQGRADMGVVSKQIKARLS